jgi:hypothetical protein
MTKTLTITELVLGLPQALNAEAGQTDYETIPKKFEGYGQYRNAYYPYLKIETMTVLVEQEFSLLTKVYLKCVRFNDPQSLAKANASASTHKNQCYQPKPGDVLCSYPVNEFSFVVVVKFAVEGDSFYELETIQFTRGAINESEYVHLGNITTALRIEKAILSSSIPFKNVLPDQLKSDKFGFVPNFGPFSRLVRALNQSQKLCISSALSDNLITLIYGPPGQLN